MLLGCLSCAQPTDTGQTGIYERLDTEAFLSRLAAEPDAQLLDVRTPDEFDRGFLSRATLVNIQDADFLTTVQRTFDPERPLYVYCQAGGRSRRAAEQLHAAGFREIYELRDGYGSLPDSD